MGELECMSDNTYTIKKLKLFPIAAAALAMGRLAEEPPKPNRGLPRRDKTQRRIDKEHRKAKRQKRAESHVQLPASGRVYAVGIDGSFLRVDGKRGIKNRAKGLIA